MKKSAFNLETALATWRHALEVRRIFLPRDLDEQERHIRDHVHHLLLKGWTEEEAFHKALAEFGNLHETEDEYRKVYLGKLQRTGLLVEEGKWQLGLLKQHLRFALRTLRRYPLYTGLNVGGFAIGIGCCLLMLLYAHHMLTYDQFHDGSERIYRVMYGVDFAEILQEASYGKANHTISAALKSTYPEHVEAFVRYRNIEATTHIGDRVLLDTLTFADPNFFEFFSFPLLYGIPETALHTDSSVVLSSYAAQRYFGTTDALGRSFELISETPRNSRHAADTFRVYVTGVMEPIPGNSSLSFDVVLPFHAADVTMEDYVTTHYVRLRQPQDVDYLKATESVFKKTALNRPASRASHFEYWPLHDLHFSPAFSYRDLRDRASDTRTYAYLLAVLGIVFVLLAASNFVMLTLAQSWQRMREIGLRKILGAHQSQLLRQFWTEALVLAGISAGLGVLIALLALPTFSQWVGEQLAFPFHQSSALVFGLVGLPLVLAILAGSYPGWLLTRHHVTALMSNGMFGARAPRHLHRLLVVPFLVFGLFLTASHFMQQQVRMLNTYDLGYDAKHVLGLHIPDQPTLRTARQRFAKELATLPFVEAVGYIGSSSSLETGHRYYWEPFDIGHGIRGHTLPVSPNIIDVLGLDLSEGYTFGHTAEGKPTCCSSSPNDSPVRMNRPTYGMIVNETFVRQGGWSSGLGKRANFTQGTGEAIVGVVRDFHLQPLDQPIRPLALNAYKQSDPDNLIVRVQPGTLNEAEASARLLWSQLAPDTPIHSYYFANVAQSLHAEEQRWLNVLTALTVLALLIAALGLIGLVHLMAAQRTKELSIRKTLGAPTFRLATLLSKDILKWVLLAFGLALPLAYWGLDVWLSSFTDQIALTLAGFGLAFGIGLLIVLSLLGLHLRRVVRIPVVQTLKSE